MQLAKSRHGRILNSRIVVVGSGFAGLKVAKALGRRRSGVTIIDRHNHHLFQPLLYQVATAALSAPDIAEPIRKILGRCPSVQFLFGDVAEIGTEGGMLVLADGTTVPYTYWSRQPVRSRFMSARTAGLRLSGLEDHRGCRHDPVAIAAVVRACGTDNLSSRAIPANDDRHHRRRPDRRGTRGLDRRTQPAHPGARLP
ncbi:FAD-dependent oxidoreductase [Mesorhizobium sp. BR115XR7A]|uniref:FAD-dependent oxidoreductase n=1 Tax=Mesorhizobium sp. BR115XR7A TaxID=2876645 RepID=UPI001CCEF76D|nr:FAD-dependent oxidoreductase [Mesorhizobium sp. BR115XR7A]MBZ9905384.1 FAD-dependent oxidoreductase [Mesorhizobium sp. BR115XR7A]MBZ9929545.1 FAD-dependent oxidoreductase [Mesorhizobium sp. BR1-1-5]